MQTPHPCVLYLLCPALLVGIATMAPTVRRGHQLACFAACNTLLVTALPGVHIPPPTCQKLIQVLTTAQSASPGRVFQCRSHPAAACGAQSLLGRPFPLAVAAQGGGGGLRTPSACSDIVMAAVVLARAWRRGQARLTKSTSRRTCDVLTPQSPATEHAASRCRVHHVSSELHTYNALGMRFTRCLAPG